MQHWSWESCQELYDQIMLLQIFDISFVLRNGRLCYFKEVFYYLCRDIMCIVVSKLVIVH